MDFKDLLRLARRRWLSIVAMFLLAVVAAAVVSLATKPMYHSTARVFIATEVSGSTEAFYASAFTAQQVKSYAQLTTSREVMERVIKQLDLDLTPAELAAKTSSVVEQDTFFIDIEVRDHSPQVAQQIAQAEAQQLRRYIAEIVTVDRGKGSAIKASITSPASYDASPVAPRTALNLVVAAIIGLILGAALAVIRDLLDNTVSSSEDVEKVLDTPVLASVGYDGEVPKRPLISDAATSAPRIEAFRLLRTNLQFLDLDHAPRSLVITSAVPSEGKTSTAANLAIALAQTGRRVLLVDGDLRRPKAAGVLGLERSVGFTTVLVGRTSLADAIQRHSESGIYFLASGPIPPNPTEVLQSNTARALLEDASEMFDMVIIDAPPLLPVSDAAILARDVDGAIIVVRHGKTTRDQLRQAGQRLTHVDAKLLGVAVNMAPKRGGRSYGYGYGYDYGYEEEAERV